MYILTVSITILKQKGAHVLSFWVSQSSDHLSWKSLSPGMVFSLPP